MKVDFLVVGKNSEKFAEEGMEMYLERLAHYLKATVTVVPSASSAERKKTLKNEGEAVLKKITSRDVVVLLDERGKEMTSLQLAGFLNQAMVNGTPRLVFVIGGAFGVDDDVFRRANHVLSFSRFTFTHQMIRVFLVEQVYRAMTIIRNESYHHP